MSAGENCTPGIVSKWIDGRHFFNGYGPTEATVGPTLYRVERLPGDGKSIPIGRPISNIQIFLLDRKFNPVPIGVPGELMVGGVGLARGYHDRADMTAEKFIPNPFSNEQGQRLYRTGDLARYLPDGNLEFIGRTDYQVKVSLTTSNFDYSKAKTNGEDIRFKDSDGQTNLNYWIETWNTTGDSVIWVNVASIPASSTKTICMYYGNDGARAASDGTAVFQFFNDFEDGNLNGWTAQDATGISTEQSKGSYSVKIYDDNLGPGLEFLQ